MHFTDIKKGKYILKALADYGILSSRTLHQVVPEIKNLRNLRKSIRGLCDKGLVIKRFDYINGGQFTYYQLNQHHTARKYIAAFLRVTPDLLLQKEYSLRHLFHEQQVCLIMHALKQKYPESLILREHELKIHPKSLAILSGLDKVDGIRPDALFIYEDPITKKSVSVAIEYERTLKSKNRIRQKLLFYTQKTLIDGVIYLSPHEDILNQIKLTYLKSVHDKSYRVKDYGLHFLLTSFNKNCSVSALNFVKSVDAKDYSLDHWLSKMMTYNIHDRLNSHF